MAVLARALPPLVFAKAAAAAVLASALQPLVFAKAAAAAVLASALQPIVFAKTAAAAVLALALLPLVFAETAAAAVLARALPPLVFAKTAAAASLHRLFRRLCSQRPLAAVPVPLAADGAGGAVGGVERLDPAAPPGVGAPSIRLFLPLDPAERLDPADPPDDGAPSACVCLPLAAGPGREALGAAKENSPDNFSRFTCTGLEVLIVISPEKVSDFTTVPQAVPVPLGSVARLDPADPPDDGAPAACV